MTPTTGNGHLDADVDAYRLAGAANTPPPVVTSDPLAGELSPIEQLVRVLGLAANLSDEQDNVDGMADHEERDILTSEAAAAFDAQDGDAAAQIAQQIPQLAAGIAGSLAGALSGAMQQVGQLPQQLTQGAQQPIQAGMGAVQAGGGYAAFENAADESLDPLEAFGPLEEDFAAGGADIVDLPGSAELGGAHGSASAGGGGTPAVPLAPALPPSVGTFLSAARSVPASPPPASGPTPVMGGGMAGVPMVPPTAMNGSGSDKDSASATKRVSVPAVRNGAPVQGRITTPPIEPATVNTARGKPVATRRVVVTRDGNPPD